MVPALLESARVPILIRPHSRELSLQDNLDPRHVSAMALALRSQSVRCRLILGDGALVHGSGFRRIMVVKPDPESPPMKYPRRSQYKYAKSPYRIRNWSEYEAGLRRRGDLTVWGAGNGPFSWSLWRVDGSDLRPLQ